MGGPKRVRLAIVWALVALAVVLSIWSSTLRPEVKRIIFREVFGSSSNMTQTDVFPEYDTDAHGGICGGVHAG